MKQILLAVLLAVQTFQCLCTLLDANCAGYVNNSQFDVIDIQNFAMVITVESGTMLNFFGRDSSCQINGTSTNWRAGKDHIRKGKFDIYNITPTYLSATNQLDNICISEMILVATNDTLNQPMSNAFYFEENGTARAICLLGHSIAYYFVILINEDLDKNSTCLQTEVNSTSNMDTNDTIPVATNESVATSTQPNDANGSNITTTLRAPEIFSPPFSVFQNGAFSGTLAVLVMIVGLLIMTIILLLVFLRKLYIQAKRGENESYVNANKSATEDETVTDNSR